MILRTLSKAAFQKSRSPGSRVKKDTTCSKSRYSKIEDIAFGAIDVWRGHDVCALDQVRSLLSNMSSSRASLGNMSK
jgi:hypothetical protein